MTDFNSLPLPEALKQSLQRMQFTTPTPIQAAAIPPALAGRDVLGTAQTGTGKTIAFTLPMLTKILSSPRGSALVMLPTRELATQVIAVVNQLLGPQNPIKSALLIGGESMPRQLQELRQRPRILIGTPGRINDHLERGSLMLHEASFLVLDETDRMLDMGFSTQIDKIVRFLPKNRQTLMFSATLPDAIIRMSDKYLTNPERIAVGATNATAANVSQELIHTSQGEKYNHLLKQLDARQGSVLVFVRTKHGAERLAQKLCKNNHRADAIHGDLHQRGRDKVIAAFRSKQYRVMVATDIASRGLDIPHIEHVINYDLPQCPEDYIHRIGRTARNGADGSSISFISPEENDKWRAIHRLLNPGEKLPPSMHKPSSNGHRPGGNSGKKNFRFRPQRRPGQEKRAGTF